MVVHCFSGKPGWTVSLQQVSSSTASFMQLQCPPVNVKEPSMVWKALKRGLTVVGDQDALNLWMLF